MNSATNKEPTIHKEVRIQLKNLLRTIDKKKEGDKYHSKNNKCHWPLSLSARSTNDQREYASRVHQRD